MKALNRSDPWIRCLGAGHMNAEDQRHWEETIITHFQKLLLRISNFLLWLSWRLVGESLQFNATKCCSLDPNVGRSTAFKLKTVAEVCYIGVYERKVKCFVITCALTTVIQLKVIISKELSPMVSTLHSWRHFHSCLNINRRTIQIKKEISKNDGRPVQNIGTLFFYWTTITLPK